MTAASTARPCVGLSVVEVAVGTSDLGLGLAGGVPGMILADLGASVVRIVGTERAPIDAGVTWSRVWHRDKHVVATDDRDDVYTRSSATPTSRWSMDRRRWSRIGGSASATCTW